MGKFLHAYFIKYFFLALVLMISCKREKFVKVNADCPCHDFRLGEGVKSFEKVAPGFELDSVFSNSTSQYKLSDDCDIDSVPVDEEITAVTRYEKVVTISAEFKSEKPLSSLVNLLKTKYKNKFKLAKSSVGNYYTTYDYVDSTYYFFYKIPRVDTANYIIKYEVGFRDEIINKIPNPESN